MKYHVLIGDNRHEVQVERQGGKLLVTLGERSHVIDVAALAEGSAYSLLLDGHSVDVGVEEQGDHVDLLIGGRRYSTEVLGEREWLARSVALASGAGDTVVRAVMTGIVNDVLVQPGDAVQAGQVVFILEAMKMENEVKAESDGTVSAVHVAAGDTVELGQAVVEIDAG